MINKRDLKQISHERKILLREDDFVYLLPRQQLCHLISNFTITFPSEDTMSDSYTIMPHGSVTLVLFKYKKNYYSFLFGPSTIPQCVGNLANKCDVIFIIEFQPSGFYSFSKINQNELKDKIIPFEVVDYDLNRSLCNCFIKETSINKYLDEIENILTHCILAEYPKELKIAMDRIIQEKGIVTAGDISNQSFYSNRHLNRLFNQYLGISMKSFSRLVKINKSIQLLNDENNSIAEVCNKLNYYDVSHFVKDFKLVCHVSPHEYRVKMSDFYSEIAKY